MSFRMRMSTGSSRNAPTQPSSRNAPTQPPEVIVIDSDSDDEYSEPLPPYTPDPDRQPGGKLNPIVIE